MRKLLGRLLWMVVRWRLADVDLRRGFGCNEFRRFENAAMLVSGISCNITLPPKTEPELEIELSCRSAEIRVQ